MGDLIAKSNDVELVQHSKNVSVVARYIAEKYMGVGGDEQDILDLISISGLLHDIGKATDKFQVALKKNKKKNIGTKFRHNEIGGAFLYKYLVFNDAYTSSRRVNYSDVSNTHCRMIANIVYWHHGISNRMAGHKIGKVLESVSSAEINTIHNLCEELITSSEFSSVIEFKVKNSGDTLNTPCYYFDENDTYAANIYNKQFGLIRTSIVSADQIVSSLEANNNKLVISVDNVSEMIDGIIEEMLLLSNKPVVDIDNIVRTNSKFDVNRYKEQEECVKNCINSSSNTVTINAPAGFGKTIVGILWGINNGKKIIWVCPRNEVAYSVYESIIDDLNLLGIDLKVELFLTGECKLNNYCEDNTKIGFTSDIIITNIDNFLAPTFSSTVSDRLFTVNCVNVIFDEYHEFVSEDAYFAGFVNLISIRHNYTNSKSLLLSATPYEMYHLWGSISDKGEIIPSKYESCKPIHDYKYKVVVTEGVEIPEDKNTLIAYNSIVEAQLMKYDTPNSELVHSKFLKDKVREKMEELKGTYGKNSNASKNKVWIGAHILQASLNVSFKNLVDVVMSPQSSLQKIGRCNRFGDYGDNSTITFTKIMNDYGKHSLSESLSIENIYNKDLYDKWYDKLKLISGTFVTLDDLYKLFNEFSKENQNDITKFINDKHNRSLTMLRNQVYPIKYDDSKEKSAPSAGSNVLRSSGSEIYVIVSKFGCIDKFEGVFTVDRSDSRFKNWWDDSKYKYLPRMVNCVKIMENNGDATKLELDYSEMMSKKNDERLDVEDIIKMARKRNTPMVVDYMEYHDEYGLVYKGYKKKNNVDDTSFYARLLNRE